ncbi:MAG: DegV family protein [Anaerolineae bacterium]
MIKIVTDSTAYLLPDQIQKYDIRVVPLKVLFGERSFREGVELSTEEFYRMLAESKELPTTSQPSSGEFLEIYSELASAGHEIISIHISSKLSGTISSATDARKMLLEKEPEAKIAIVDSLSTSAGLAMEVLAAAHAAQEGRSAEEILTVLENMVKEIKLFFVVDTLEYLHRGGRIGGAAALFGTLLKIKPILHLKDGRVEPLDRARTKRKALQRLLELAEEEIGGCPAHIILAHGDAFEDMVALEEEVRARLNFLDIQRTEIGPVIGTHAGPGVVGLAFYIEPG